MCLFLGFLVSLTGVEILHEDEILLGQKFIRVLGVLTDLSGNTILIQDHLREIQLKRTQRMGSYTELLNLMSKGNAVLKPEELTLSHPKLPVAASHY